MTGPHHSIIRRFTSSGHGAAECTTACRLETSARGPHVVGQLQQPVELRRHHVRGEHAVLLDEPQRLGGVEARHDHQRVPDVERAHVVGVAPAVVHGGRHEVRAAEGHEVEGAAEHRGVVGDLPGIADGLRAADALGPAGGPRRVHEQRARRAGIRFGDGVRGTRVVERLEAGDVTDRERRRQRARSTVATCAAKRSSATSTRAPECSTMVPTSCSVRNVLSGMKYHPASLHASHHSTRPMPLGSSAATASPGCTPRARNRCTSWCARPASSA